MNVIKRMCWAIALCLVSALFLAASAYPDNNIAEKNFKANPGGKLTISSDQGAIQVRTHKDKLVGIKITSREELSPKEIEELLDIRFDQDGDNVSVDVDVLKKRGWFSAGRNLNLLIVANIPKKFDVDLSTAGGSIWVDDLEGRLEARTAGGSLQFGDITGPIIARTAGGSISVQGGKGQVDVKTSGGSINLGHVVGHISAKTAGGSIEVEEAAGDLEVKTSGGSITLNKIKGKVDASTSGGSIHATIAGQPSGDCRLVTSAGTITVQLSSEAAVDVDARSSVGKVVSEFPVKIQGEMSDHRLTGKINGGGPLLYLRASAGYIHIRKL